MALEIERKYLVKPGWIPQGNGTVYLQGYLRSDTHGPTVRVRVAGDRGFLTVKGPLEGLARLEFEYAIPVEDARKMLAAFADGRLVEKIRYAVEHAGHVWEVDVFQGRNAGLIVAEIELASPDEEIALPDWVSEEVSSDPRYANASLALYPWPEWEQLRGKQ